MKLIYPLLTTIGKKMGVHAGAWHNRKQVTPTTSFYNLHAQLNSGAELSFEKLRGKKVLISNTATDCGYAAQLDELQQLKDAFGDKLIVLGFPANDFKEQEKGSDEEIQSFCSLNFGVQFPLAKKSVVIKNDEQNEVFKWLTHADMNGWNNHGPKWNFYKYLVDEKGVLTDVFAAAVSPLSSEIKQKI